MVVEGAVDHLPDLTLAEVNVCVVKGVVLVKVAQRLGSVVDALDIRDVEGVGLSALVE